ncbi:bifunctional phosphopantothenoylcysteine decarboxylase/phosphopantothenate--cysteine ligase CoaBC [Clavibacter michiganensis]|uniref:bifunctional phosphopantothenoylcysteine decarboxylase/phosphopantothenate--cysteine ligase CoaBC n=1 Tax=Clavibacter michiganensis TaxID=28447 RepID=UPI000B54A79B|nr:bifunctional phosphopantothenoylcysteine decarboxylase/phosphopantothenate--cysteine ligase CoaBC [Clavibacter michiganensis]MDO4055399.1 bifunctional phosphopantothenoylcysteine decarboxylase/phosphopantothenate--cysteine ligase CoaBC [Clavibacter michiganensis]MDO4068871.1 bifunctional phosphopantothenoylcysteine decarboxylase/phosphopantothenate--cysteine ligase CoaBC [Clavibacter michiganensis]MDO4087843.1 bifunctional phosphopantothenoylcysteine decarboxylase/phosphopantothenate--cystein
MVVVGITGGIAAYKAVGVVRGLVLLGHDVHVVPTEAALRFVGKPTLEAVSRNPVTSDLYDGVSEVRHVALGQKADLIVVAPATAHTLATMALGLSDDLLGTTILASRAPLVVAPAMHTEMWQHPATQANAALLRSRGATLVGPTSGRLTGTDSGPGRMAEVEDVIAAALAAVRPGGRDLAGRRVVVSAGGTREPLDPVRFLGNRSSGRQGVALAVAARDRGADVVLVAAHLEVPSPAGVRVVPVSTALEMSDAMASEADDADVVIMAAAVADYRPVAVSAGKIKKEEAGDALSVELVRNPDILQRLASDAAVPRADGTRRLVVGFAAETEEDPAELLRIGRAKLARKGCDLLVLNRVGWSEGFATEGNTITVLGRSGDTLAEASGSKEQVAHRILDVVGAPTPQ